MATIRKEIMIEAKPEQVWDAVRDVGAVHRRFVPGYTVDTRLDGDYRILTFSNGAVVRELIVAVDDEVRRLAYAVVEGRMPLVHHHASFQVFAENDSRSRLVWITDFLPHELEAEIRMRVERGAEVMKQTIEAEVQADSRCHKKGDEK
ncbi:SRPBCC family protein [Paenibacillus tyrfis]|uniref:Polyketide cyclase n=1 Tax=Paenibacillus tyrfis TaxID=1501230 RepID=A0A081P9M5_9BACL|nr:SRPBCC family protein [Paenibacillus tyrfis]KEQ27398.1 polyketide cyclase [Paenibacillus tyrfis]